MHTIITNLIENNLGVDTGLQAEHGLSFLIQRGKRTILFDTGQSDKIVRNARVLGVRLDELSDVVISHNHYDHTDGLTAVVKAGYTPFVLHLHERFFDHKFNATKVGPDGGPKYIGASWDKRWCTQSGISPVFVTGTGRDFGEGVHIVTQFERVYTLEVDDPKFVVQRSPDAALEVDDFRDEIALVLETRTEGREGLVMIVGCSHPGIMNMVATVRKRFGLPIHALLGGTHLVDAHGPRLEQAVEVLTAQQAGASMVLGLSHCTGEIAMDALERRSTLFRRVVTGSVVEFG